MGIYVSEVDSSGIVKDFGSERVINQANAWQCPLWKLVQYYFAGLKA